VNTLAARPLVHVVDDDERTRTSLSRLLRAAGFDAACYADARDFMASDSFARPGCVVLDVNLPELNGLDFFEAMQRQGVSLPVVFLTGFGDIPMTVRAMKAGAVDFLTKPIERSALLDAIARALERDDTQRAARESTAAVRERYESLTTREREVFAHVVAGRLNKQIACDLNAAVRTVKAHRAHVMSKMRVRSVADLVRLGEQLGVRGPARAGATAAEHDTPRDRRHTVAAP
jgi:FixJ family two-component response regulator